MRRAGAVGDEDESGETPEQLRERAEGLRDCARRARELAGTLGPFLDGETELAQRQDPVTWQGPYAERTTAVIRERGSTLHAMAGALMNDAGRWESEATDLEERAGRAEGGN
ncbi:hypothetical protein [Streptomyces sp. 6N223]|uniref:hypothetical protein n=1 Tax=Streptomyces sp. 6N223 TaxID=3457412 RepID=UPI003FD0DDF8